ncbi:11.9 kDa wall protein [Tuber borchii]|uniref:11.9 kDa wall protein n=1 Tax=Tuber borchii TaxID=42251 RepID=A0A2T6ZJP2_TUBBO|nr:11.9 kDa wall protein [Tuber borchii]
MASTEESSFFVTAGNYHIRKDNLFLAVGQNKSIITQAGAYTWTVSVQGTQNYLQDPTTTHYLHDNSTDNVLAPGQTIHARWSGGSVEKPTHLINAGTRRKLNIPYGGSTDLWKFELA